MRVIHSIVICEKPPSKRPRIRSNYFYIKIFFSINYLVVCVLPVHIYEPEHNKPYKITCAYSEISDQPRDGSRIFGTGVHIYSAEGGSNR